MTKTPEKMEGEGATRNFITAVNTNLATAIFQTRNAENKNSLADELTTEEKALLSFRSSANQITNMHESGIDALKERVVKTENIITKLTETDEGKNLVEAAVSSYTTCLNQEQKAGLVQNLEQLHAPRLAGFVNDNAPKPAVA